MDRRFDVSSFGELYRKSVENLAEKITDVNGNEIALDSIVPGQKAFIYFTNGTGFTRTSAVRVQ